MLTFSKIGKHTQVEAFLVARVPIDIQTALEWFELDKATVSEEKVKAAYRILAKRYHPDTRGNYKEKLSASENFVAATKTKALLLEAYRTGRLPIQEAQTPKTEAPAQGKVKWSGQFKTSYAKKLEPETPPRRYEDTLTGRRKYDYHNKRPMEKLMDVPYIGGAFAFVFCIGAMFAMMTGVLALSPFIMIYPFVKNFINTQKLGDMLTGIPLFIIYFAATYLGVLMIADGNNWSPWWLLSLVWGSLGMIALDEVYSFIRYQVISREVKKGLAVILESSSEPLAPT
ncbi:MAG: hypothetical protein WC043_05740 [Pseudobdellovibrionaceae bacterium]